jgi:SAM-dependent methyltransferase
MERYTKFAGPVFNTLSMTLIAQPKSIFDQAHYVRHIEARGKLIRRLVPELKRTMPLTTALDAGCGLGFFANLLRENALEVHAFDGRENNVEESRKRYPQITFSQGDIEDKSILQLKIADLVLCFGLLYHLENPLRAIRNLRALTGKILLLETMCLPISEPRALLLVERDADDQSLTDLAFYPSEGCIVKMLYHAGFEEVYRVASLPEHDDFLDTPSHTRRRTVVVASFEPLNLSGLILIREPQEPADPWKKPPSSLGRVGQFLARLTSSKTAGTAD